MHTRIIIITLALFVGQNVLLAEMRTWSDKKGNTIEAEFVNIVGGKVLLKTATGKQLKVPASGLCASDQKFLENAIPPRLDIKVNIDTDAKKITEGYSYTSIRETVQGTVTIEKKNRESSTKSFKAILYTFSKDFKTDEFMLITRSEHSFTFKTKKKITFTGDKGTTRHQNWDSDTSKGKSGDKYEGYLVVIEDDKGLVLCSKGSRNLFEERASQFKGKQKGAKLDFLSRN